MDFSGRAFKTLPPPHLLANRAPTNKKAMGSVTPSGAPFIGETPSQIINFRRYTPKDNGSYSQRFTPWAPIVPYKVHHSGVHPCSGWTLHDNFMSHFPWNDTICHRCLSAIMTRIKDTKRVPNLPTEIPHDLAPSGSEMGKKFQLFQGSNRFTLRGRIGKWDTK